MKSSPFISIIVPAYNNPTELHNCLHSLRQNMLTQNFEVIVIDDCSPDKGREIEQAAQKYRARLYRMNVNAGPGKARNCGAHEAIGDILVFIDSDCVAPPGWILKLTQPIIDGKYVATTSCYCGPVAEMWITVFQNEDYSYRMPSRECDVSFINSCNFAIDRNAFLSCGGFPERRLQEDFLLGLILVQRGTPARYLPEAGVKHDYCNTIISYLRQRFIFAYNAAGSSLVRDKLRSQEASSNARSFNPLRTAAGMFFISSAVISLVLSGISFILSMDLAATLLTAGLICLAAGTLVHGLFLLFLIKRQRILRSLSYISLLYLLDVVYTYGVFKALISIGKKQNVTVCTNRDLL